MPSSVELVGDRVLTVVGLVLVVAALGWSAIGGAGVPGAAVGALAVLGLGALAYDAVVWVLDERQPGGLVLPPDAPGLPAPAWWAPVGAAGLAVSATGLLAAAPALLVLGVVVVVAALAGLARRSRTSPTRSDVRQARALQRGFSSGPAGPAPPDDLAPGPASTAVVQARVHPIGNGVQRLVVEQQGVVRADVVLRRAAQVAMLAGLTVRTD